MKFTDMLLPNCEIHGKSLEKILPRTACHDRVAKNKNKRKITRTSKTPVSSF